MIASVVLAVALATPQPWPTPLKTIVHVHSSALCTTLTQNVFAAVEGLRLNDKLADQSRHVLNRFAYGQSTAMDEMRLERLSLDMEHNFERIDAVLADAKRFPSPPKTDDDKVAAALKAQLQEVEKHQRETFNLLYGIYDTLHQVQTVLGPCIITHSWLRLYLLQKTPLQKLQYDIEAPGLFRPSAVVDLYNVRVLKSLE